MTFDYDDWAEAAHEKLQTLYKRRAALDDEIEALQRAFRTLKPLIKNPEKWFGSNEGITDAIRAILKSKTHKFFSAPEIRDALIARGVLLKQQHPLAAVHQLLANLVQQDEATFALKHSTKRYQWKGASGQAAAGESSPPKARASR